MKHWVGCWVACCILACGTAPQTAPEFGDTGEDTQAAAFVRGENLAAALALPGAEADPADARTADAAAAACDLGGAWLMELSIPVRWDANAQIDAGSGRVRLRATSLRKAAGNLLIDGLTPCAMALPATARKSGARLRTRFPKAAFAKGAHTITPALTSLRGTEPGARFRMQPFALQYGAVIPNPTMAPWPEAIEDNAVDVDNDGHPGITVRVETREQAMARDPVTRLYVAWRVVVHTAGGKVETCDTLEGLGTVPALGGDFALNVSVMGCAKRSGAACSASEADMAAAWLPTYLKDGNVALRVTRVGEDTPGVCAPF